jgi:DNA-binding response OmpR family regulator
VELTRKEYGVLRLLAAREGVVVTRDELLENRLGV